jgi:ATP-dependent exoDNAse (exonuclease V) alpha subunit
MRPRTRKRRGPTMISSRPSECFVCITLPGANASRDTAESRLYVLDESSLASTRQMHEFIARLRPNARVLLVGDTRQHEAVEAGRPFAQLQEAGM